MTTFEQKQISQLLKTLSHKVEKVVPIGLKISALLPLYKNIMFYALIFYLALLEVYEQNCIC
jgi:hypothetical protein